MHSSPFLTLFISGAFVCLSPNFSLAQTCSGGSPANTYNLNFNGKASVDSEGDPDNDSGILSTNSGDVVAVAFNTINFVTLGDSFCDEVYFGADGDGPGPDYSFSLELNSSPCSNLPYNSGIIDLVALNFQFPTSGSITWEMFEAFDNFPDQDDALYLSGIVTFYVCPTGQSLPIHLRSFTGTAGPATNMLNWVNATQHQVQWQIIERSADGRQGWQEVGRIGQNPDATTDTRYQWEDQQPIPDAYYRLRIVDFDGSEQVSFMIRLTRPGETFGIMSLYPNPVSDRTQIQVYQAESSFLTATVVDMYGRRMLQQGFEMGKGVQTLSLPFDELTPGVYFLGLEDDRGNKDFQSFVKQ